MNPWYFHSGALLSLEQARARFPADSPLCAVAASARAVAAYPSVVSVDLSADVENGVLRVELWIHVRGGEQALRGALESFGQRVAVETGFTFSGLVPTHWPVFGNLPSRGFVLLWAGPCNPQT